MDSLLASRSAAPSSRVRFATAARHRLAGERGGVALMVAGGVLLGTLGVFVEQAGQHPLTAVFFRCLFGALALLAWGAATGRLRELRLDARGLATALAAGALMVLNWTLFFAAIARIPIGVATVSFHVQALWVLALAAWWLKERVTRVQCVAAAAALGGLALAAGWGSGRAGAAFDTGYLAGLAMCLGGSLSYALVTLIAKRAQGFAHAIGSFALSFWQCAAGALLLAWWPFVHGWPAAPSAWAWLAGLGLIHTGLAYVLLYAGMARLSAARVAVLQFVYPVAAVLVDWAVYGHALAPLQWLGVAVMGVALWGARGPAPSRRTSHDAD